MTSQQILQSDFLDILFDNRNKAYGAYTLRKNYSAQLTKALLIAFPSIFLLLFCINPSGKNVVNNSDSGGIILKDYKIPEVQKPKQELVKPQVPKAPRLKQLTFVDPKIVDKEEVPPLANQDQLLHAGVSNITSDGLDMQPTIDAPKITEPGIGAASKSG